VGNGFYQKFNKFLPKLAQSGADFMNSEETYEFKIRQLPVKGKPCGLEFIPKFSYLYFHFTQIPWIGTCSGVLSRKEQVSFF
jgi:hypothetical protein